MGNSSKGEKDITKLRQKLKFYFSGESRDGDVSTLRKLYIIFSIKGLKWGVQFTFRFMKAYFNAYIIEKFNKLFVYKKTESAASNRYQEWLNKNLPTNKKLQKYADTINCFHHKPLVSVITSVGKDVEYDQLKQTLAAVEEQIYPNWELHVTFHNCRDLDKFKIVENYENNFPNVFTEYSTAYKSEASAFHGKLEQVKGEYVLYLRSGDVITKDALFQFVKLINERPETDFVYADEDEINKEGLLTNPQFKPAWSPDLALSFNYLNNFNVIRSSILKSIEPAEQHYKSQFYYDLVLKVSEKTERIYQLSQLLYHHRPIECSLEITQEIVEKAIERRGENAKVEIHDPMMNSTTIRYKIDNQEKVSIVIPSRNQAGILERCLVSIFKLTTYQNFEVILVNNGSDEQSFFDLVGKWQDKEPERFYAMDLDVPFNYALLNNEATKIAGGDYLLFLNNDTEILEGAWLEKMIEQAQRESVGAVGVKLLFQNKKIQHAGIVFGSDGKPMHCYMGQSEEEISIKPLANTVKNISALTAACLMVRKEAFDTVNGFDEQFAVDYNDIDLCLRLRKAGYANVYLPHVSLLHYEGFSRGNNIYASMEKFKKYQEETELFKERWESYSSNDPYYSISEYYD